MNKKIMALILVMVVCIVSFIFVKRDTTILKEKFVHDMTISNVNEIKVINSENKEVLLKDHQKEEFIKALLHAKLSKKKIKPDVIEQKLVLYRITIREDDQPKLSILLGNDLRFSPFNYDIHKKTLQRIG